MIELNEHRQVRRVLTQRDANGMTFLHHAINAKSDGSTSFPSAQGQFLNPLVPAPDEWSPDAMFVVENSEGDEKPTPVSNAELLDPWVPVVKSAFKFARASLWLAEVRLLIFRIFHWWLLRWDFQLERRFCAVMAVVIFEHRPQVYICRPATPCRPANANEL